MRGTKESWDDRILILCKTYPSPSSKYSETSCVAGMTHDGVLIRLFPVPFRLISDEQQFKKWQWINARISKAPADHRPESHRLFVDTIKLEGAPIPSARKWADRRPMIDKLQIVSDFAAVEDARGANASGPTLALLRPKRVVGLDITPVAEPDWTEEDQQKLVAHQHQAGLFDAGDAKAFRSLRKLPYDFHYRYACDTATGEQEYRHKISDWEAGALYWTCKSKYGAGWEAPFRAKLEEALPQADLMFLMGTIHRFPDKWLIVSLIYPPKQPANDGPPDQGSLFPL
jgi:hypothetical protein